VLSEESTAAVVEACKREGVSVTSAWHAALAMAVQVSLISFQSLTLTVLGEGFCILFFINILSEPFMRPFSVYLTGKCYLYSFLGVFLFPAIIIPT